MEESSLNDINLTNYLSDFSENGNDSIYIINGKNEEYLILIIYGNTCDEDLLKQNYFSFNLIQSNTALRRLDEIIANNEDIESFYKIIINNNIN